MKQAYILPLAEAALSPLRAWEYDEINRRHWPQLTKTPDDACRFFGRADIVKALIWC